MNRISEHDLRQFVDQHRSGLPHPLDLLMYVGENVLASFFGVEWVESMVREGKAGSFIRANPAPGLETSRHVDRVVSLAEMLFNFQGVPGLEAVVERVKNNDYQSGIAELEAGRFLAMCRLPFEFNPTTGTRGTDYDLTAWLRDGSRIACESKCKLESTTRSLATVRNALNDARGQLPNDCVTVVFLKIPESWLTSFAGIDIRFGIAQAFATTGRISAVVVHWEQWENIGQDGSRRRVKYDVQVNPNARVQCTELDVVLETQGIPEGWCNFHKLVDFPSLGPA